MATVSVTHHELFIGGKQVDTDAVYEIRSPATEELVCTVAKGRVPEADAEVGTIWINAWHMVDPAMPFGGYKQSGVGRELGRGALDEYTEVKHVHLDLSRRADQLPYDILLSQPA